MWKNFTDPQRALTSTSSRPLGGINRETASQTSVSDLTNALLKELANIPTDTLQNLVRKASQKSGGFYSCKGGEATPYYYL